MPKSIFLHSPTDAAIFIRLHGLGQTLSMRIMAHFMALIFMFASAEYLLFSRSAWSGGATQYKNEFHNGRVFCHVPNKRIEARPSDHEVAPFDGRQPRSQSRANIPKRFITIGNLCRVSLVRRVGKKIYLYLWRYVDLVLSKDRGDSIEDK